MSLAPVSALAEYLNVTDDEAGLARLLAEAESALGRLYRLPTIPAETTTLYLWADDGVVWLPDCTAVTACADRNSTSLSYIAERKEDGGYDRLLLHEPISETVAVSGTFGVAACPPDVVRAIVVTAGSWYRRQMLGDNNAIGRLSAIPDEAKDLLDARRAVRF